MNDPSKIEILLSSDDMPNKLAKCPGGAVVSKYVLGIVVQYHSLTF